MLAHSASRRSDLAPSLVPSTLKPETLAHPRQLEEYHAILDKLGSTLPVSSSLHTAVPAAAQLLGHTPRVGVGAVDELGVEWCYFCGRERKREDLELVDLDDLAKADVAHRVRHLVNDYRGGEVVGKGMQWVCRHHCEAVGGLDVRADVDASEGGEWFEGEEGDGRRGMQADMGFERDTDAGIEARYGEEKLGIAAIHLQDGLGIHWAS